MEPSPPPNCQLSTSTWLPFHTPENAFILFCIARALLSPHVVPDGEHTQWSQSGWAHSHTSTASTSTPLLPDALTSTPFLRQASNMQGYDDLASHMAQANDLAIFRRFLPLHSKNILLYESQIVHKQRDLIEAIKKDRESTDELRRSFAFDNHAMLTAPSPPDEAAKGQKEIWHELRPLLKEYST